MLAKRRVKSTPSLPRVARELLQILIPQELQKAAKAVYQAARYRRLTLQIPDDNHRYWLRIFSTMAVVELFSTNPSTRTSPP